MKSEFAGRLALGGALLAMVLALGPHLAAAAEPPLSYESAKRVWEESKDTPAYQTYASQFAQFNNHFHLDGKDGCYAMDRGPVNLMLVISHKGKSEFATIEKVFADVDNPKSRCLRKSYSGIPTKIPPFYPFVVQMTMTGTEAD